MRLLDASALTHAARHVAPVAEVPEFWRALLRENRAHRVFSVAAVRSELAPARDDLARWARSEAGARFFLPPSARLVMSLERVARAVLDSGRHGRSARLGALDGSDLLVVAEAHALGATVVTAQRSLPTSRTSLPLPQICELAGVPWLGIEALHPRPGLRQEPVRSRTGGSDTRETDTDETDTGEANSDEANTDEATTGGATTGERGLDGCDTDEADTDGSDTAERDETDDAGGTESTGTRPNGTGTRPTGTGTRPTSTGPTGTAQTRTAPTDTR